MVKTFYETAWEFFEAVGDPSFFMPKRTTDNIHEYEFKQTRSFLRVTTASGRAVGRSDRNDDVYAVELADWEPRTAADALANLLTSQPVGAQDIRATIDFNANENWLSSHAYVMWEGARVGDNGFSWFFSGTDDLPELYTPAFMDEQRRSRRSLRPAGYCGL
jgi:hypothetical protein